MPITSTKNVRSEVYGKVSPMVMDPTSRWWLAPDEEIHGHAWSVLKRIKQHQNYRTMNYLKYARLYSNMEIASLQGMRLDRTNEAQLLSNRVTYNIVKACIDTASSKIGARKPRPMFLTENASYDLQERAKKLNSFFQGLYSSIGCGTGEDRTMWGLGRQCFTDACLFGTGAIKFYESEGELKSERVFIDEIYVDDAEGRYRSPRQMHQVKLVFREVLYDMFPDPRSHAIIDAAPTGFKEGDSSRTTADMVEVVESWHLASGKGANDGKHVIYLENGTLHAEEYKKDYFPFLFLRWSLEPLGFYGRGLADELVGIQLEINKHLRTIQMAQHLAAVPQVWMDISSKIPGKRINNEIGGINYYRGTPPIFMTPNAMSSEVYNHLESLWRKGFEITGISMLSATSAKPSGLNSGRALREYKDIQTERFAMVENAYEDFYMEATYLCLDMLRDMVEAGMDPIVQTKGAHYTEQLKFSDIDIPDDKMSIRPYPTNFLPSEPAGKFETVQDLVKAGFYTQEEALELLDFPDIAKMNRLKLSARQSITKVIEHNIKHANDMNKQIAPDPRMNLRIASELVNSYILRGIVDNMNEQAMDVLRNFQDQIDALLNSAEQQQMQPAQLPASEQPAPVPSPEEVQAMDMMMQQQGAG